jgi:heptosyltransferase-2
VGRRLRSGRFDAALLLPNSFRWAATTWLAGIPRRIGYDRDMRRWLLSRAVPKPRKPDGSPEQATREEYLLLSRAMLQMVGQPLPVEPPDLRPQLSTRPADDAWADTLLGRLGYPPTDPRPLVVLNPGASFGPAKRWPAERFAELGRRLQQKHGAVVALSGSPGERPVLDEVQRAAGGTLLDWSAEQPVSLRRLKSLLRRARVMFSNDTGARHVALALGVPVVTIYGPTDPARTDLGLAEDATVRLSGLPCSPCQQKTCPLGHHRCMQDLSVGAVLKAGEPWLGR